MVAKDENNKHNRRAKQCDEFPIKQRQKPCVDYSVGKDDYFVEEITSGR